jgi:gluconokinase
MHAGIALNDEDREPWLETLSGLLRGWYQSGEGGVLACSALKEKYRQTLERGIPANAIKFVWLDPSKKVLEERLATRHHAYMNPNLLRSQIATLEPPKDALRVTADGTPDQIVNEILQHVSLSAEPGQEKQQAKS